MRVEVRSLLPAGFRHSIPLSFVLIGSLVLLGEMIAYSGYGMDFTDEGFYLNWISAPFSYGASTSQFGYIYHPLYEVLNGDIAGLRLANILITFGLAAWAAFIIVGEFPRGAIYSLNSRLALSFGVSTTALMQFRSWLLTPNYNSLTLQALLICAIGLLLIERQPGPKSLSACLLIAVGGWLAFMAKPSSAVLLAILVVFHLIFVLRCSFKVIAAIFAITVFLVLGAAFLIYGSVASFYGQVKEGMALGADMGSGHTLLGVIRLDDFSLNTHDKIFTAFLILVWGIGARFSGREAKVGNLASLLVAFALLCAIVSAAMLFWSHDFGFSIFFSLSILWVSVAAAAVSLWCGRFTLSGSSFGNLSIAGIFFLYPYAYVFGTNGNYWAQGASASVFWILGCLVVMAAAGRSVGWGFAIPLVLASELVVALQLHLGMVRPYRQPESLGSNDVLVRIGRTDSKLLLSSDFARYVEEAQQISWSAGLKPGTHIIDLTGQSPGLLYALGAASLGRPWLIGGYPGSALVAKKVLSSLPCGTLASAWVLVEPSGPRAIPVSVLAEIGLNFPDEFVDVGGWRTAAGAGGYVERRRQMLFRPNSVDAAGKQCETIRRRESAVLEPIRGLSDTPH